MEPPPIAEQIEVRIVDLETLTLLDDRCYTLHRAHTPNEDCFFIFLDAAQHWLASGSEDKQAYLWDREHGSLVSRLAHRAVVNGVAFNPRDPQMMVSVSDDHTIKVWRSKAQMNIRNLPVIQENQQQLCP